MITELAENEILVFGSNLDGVHAGGAAKQANEQFGAIWGIGAGLTGQCYAIPTMGTLRHIELYVEQFIRVATLMPQYTFLVTKIGTGIAGYSEALIAPMFKDVPDNVVLPDGWKDYVAPFETGYGNRTN